MQEINNYTTPIIKEKYTEIAERLQLYNTIEYSLEIGGNASRYNMVLSMSSNRQFIHVGIRNHGCYPILIDRNTPHFTYIKSKLAITNDQDAKGIADLLNEINKIIKK